MADELMDLEDIQILEESLWRPEFRFDREYMNSILAPGFFEFGRSGRIWSRQEALDVSPVDIGAKLPLPDLSIELVAATVALVTYRSVTVSDARETANRSSLWSLIDGRWQLLFHQGTPTN